jgi:hypothetical protein
MRSLSIIFLFACFSSVLGQSGELNTNNSKVSARNDGTFFYYPSSYAGYVIPQSGTKATIHSASLWLSGIEDNNQSHLSAVVLSGFGTDFTPGPVSNQPVDTKSDYNFVYKISDKIIDDHKKDPSTNDYRIYNWPGNGDESKGEPAVIASFIDLNNNGIYEPEEGEYPKLIGHSCIYSIFNDQANQGFTSGSSMGLDIHQYIYQLSSYIDGDTLRDTNFARFVIINRSAKNYSKFKFGVYVNIGLGNPDDDYMGTDSSLNMAYGYNGDDFDESVVGYGLNPPMQGAMFLNTKLGSSTLILQDQNEKNGLPRNSSQFENYLNGKYKDGSVKTITNQNRSLTSKYDYPGNLNYTDNFTEKDFDNAPGDRNILLVAQHAYIGVGDTLIYDLAFPYARLDFGGATSAYDSLKNLASHLYKRYNSDYSWITKAKDNRTSLSITNRETHPTFTVYPNPSTGHYSIEGLKNNEPSIITNITGQVVKEIEPNATSFDITNLESGVYFLRTEAGSVRLLKM